MDSVREVSSTAKLRSPRGALGWALVFALAWACGLALVSSFGHPPYKDEVGHRAAIQLFVEEGISREALTGFRASNGPLPYLVQSQVARLFGDGLTVLRLSSILLFALPFAFLVGLNLSVVDPEDRGPRRSLVFAAVLMTPHILTTSFAIYSEPSALLLVQASLLAWLLYVRGEERSTALLALALVAAGMAILSRQFFLFLFPALLLPLWLDRGLRRRDLALAAAAFLPAALLFLLWGGFTPPYPHFRATNSLAWTPALAPRAVMMLGAYAWPLAFVLRPSRKVLAGALALAGMTLAAGLTFPDGPWNKIILAVSGAAGRAVPALEAPLRLTAWAVFAAAGWSVVLALLVRLRRSDGVERLVALALVFYLLQAPFAGIHTYERYVSPPLVPFLALLLVRLKTPIPLLVLWLVEMGLLAVPLGLRWTGLF